MRNIGAGVVLIVIGLVMGRSLFLGDRSTLSWIFDGLGIVLIVVGLVQVVKQRQAPPQV